MGEVGVLRFPQARGRAWLAVGLTALFALAGCGPGSGERALETRAVVIGLDGADWKLIEDKSSAVWEQWIELSWSKRVLVGEVWVVFEDAFASELENVHGDLGKPAPNRGGGGGGRPPGR